MPRLAVENLEATRAFAGNHDQGVMLAELDLANRAGGGVDLPENDRRAACRASRRTTRRSVAALPDLNSRWSGIEVRLEHRLVSINLATPARKHSFGERRAPLSIALPKCPYAHTPSITLTLATVGTILVTSNPAAAYSERNSTSERWRPPVLTSMLTSLAAAPRLSED